MQLDLTRLASIHESTDRRPLHTSSSLRKLYTQVQTERTFDPAASQRSVLSKLISRRVAASSLTTTVSTQSQTLSEQNLSGQVAIKKFVPDLAGDADLALLDRRSTMSRTGRVRLPKLDPAYNSLSKSISQAAKTNLISRRRFTRNLANSSGNLSALKKQMYSNPQALEQLDTINEVFRKLASLCSPGKLASQILVVSSGLDLQARLRLKHFRVMLYGISDSELTAAFNFLDSSYRGFVHLHTLATMADLYQAGDIGQLPMQQNPKTPKYARELFKGLAKVLAEVNETAYEFYSFMGLKPEQRLKEQTFVNKMRHELAARDAQALFNLCASGGTVIVYHFMTVVDSYSLDDPLKWHVDNIKSEVVAEINAAVMEAVSILPEDQSNYELFHGVHLTDVFNSQDFSVTVQSVLHLSATQCTNLFCILDESSFGIIFAYQLFTYLDHCRCEVIEGLYVYAMPSLPVKSKASLDLAISFTALARNCDLKEVPSSTAWDVALDSKLSRPDFEALFPGHSDMQKSRLFNSLAIFGESSVTFYHFVAVLDSYRKSLRITEDRRRRLRIAK